MGVENIQGDDSQNAYGSNTWDGGKRPSVQNGKNSLQTRPPKDPTEILQRLKFQ